MHFVNALSVKVKILCYPRVKGLFGLFLLFLLTSRLVFVLHSINRCPQFRQYLSSCAHVSYRSPVSLFVYLFCNATASFFRSSAAARRLSPDLIPPLRVISRSSFGLLWLFGIRFFSLAIPPHLVSFSCIAYSSA